MIEKALRYVIGLKEPNYREINGRMYVDKDVTELTEPTVKPLRVNTLKAVVDYVVPVSYTHLGVYKRQEGSNRAVKRLCLHRLQKLR